MSAVQHFARNTTGTDYVVSDIHGCFDLLRSALEALSFDEQHDRLFSVGDLVDRGSQSEEAIDWIAKPWFHAVRGNHEQMAIGVAAGRHDKDNYRRNGGGWFLELDSQLGSQLGSQLYSQLGSQQIRYMGTRFWGSMDYIWGWADGGRRVGAIYPPDLNGALDDHLTITHSIGWWYPFDEFCVLTGRPTVIARDDQGRLHCADGPALRYADSYSLYMFHGVAVPTDVIEQPESITTDRIDNESNAEVRRVMIEQYGTARYLLDSDAVLMHCDATGILYRRDMPDDEPIVMVRVLNSTPEPDGVMSRDEAIAAFGDAARAAIHAPADARFKEYMIRVPPQIQRAHDAVAWTFGLDAETYHPAIES